MASQKEKSDKIRAIFFLNKKIGSSNAEEFMNAYLKNVRYNNNARGRKASTRRFGDGLISFICAIIGTVTCPAAVMLEKTAAVFALFVSFFGLVGMIEAGAISMFWGIALGAVISVTEYAILKSMFKKKKPESDASV